MSNLNNQKGSGIIGAILIVLIVSVMGAVIASLLTAETGGALNYMHSRQAFFVAEGGLEYYLKQLQNETGSWLAHIPSLPVNEALGAGTFTITAANIEEDKIDVTSTAHVPGLNGRTVVRAVTALALRTSAPGNVPEAFYYACYAEPNILFGQSAGSVINGDIRAEKKVQVKNGWTVNGTLYPDSPLPFPYVNFESYRTMIETEYGSGHVIDGAFTFLQDQTYDGLYYVTGNVTVESGVTLNGGIVTEGMINMRHASSSVVLASPGEPALVAKKNINISDSSDVALTGTGLIYTEQGLNLDQADNSGFSGTFIVKQNMSANNTSNITISFNPAIIEQPPPFFKTSFGVINWDEVY